jgi:hypothetical protein
MGLHGSEMIKALGYKAESLGFETRLSKCLLSFTESLQQNFTFLKVAYNK